MDDRLKELIEDFSKYFEDIYHFPPLTSKVYAYLMLDCNSSGVTFDELVEVLNASKSSVSTSLNFLTQLKHIEYYTKIDNRKRFYRISSENLLVRLKKILDMLSNEKYLVERLKTYRLETCEGLPENSILKSDIYLDHLTKSIGQLSQTIEKLESFHPNT
ncbi:MAG: transcriptional regulator [Moheibacter sp.]